MHERGDALEYELGRRWGGGGGGKQRQGGGWGGKKEHAHARQVVRMRFTYPLTSPHLENELGNEIWDLASIIWPYLAVSVFKLKEN